MQPPRLADTAEREYFTLRERLITMRKTTGRNPEVYYSSSVDIARRIDTTYAIIVSNTHALPAEYKCLK